jgi:hypothetical protein
MKKIGPGVFIFIKMETIRKTGIRKISPNNEEIISKMRFIIEQNQVSGAILGINIRFSILNRTPLIPG